MNLKGTRSNHALGLALTCSLFSIPLYAETVYAEDTYKEDGAAVIAAHPSTSSEPERVYVETGSATHRSTRSEEYCFYNEEHDHIHCYDQDPRQQQDRVVIVENTVHRSTRYQHRRDPISTGIGVGVAIGLPLLIHHGIHDRHRSYRNDHHYKRHGFSSSFRHSYGKHHGKSYGKGFRKGHRNDYKHGRQSRSKRYRANLP